MGGKEIMSLLNTNELSHQTITELTLEEQRYCIRNLTPRANILFILLRTIKFKSKKDITAPKIARLIGWDSDDVKLLMAYLKKKSMIRITINKSNGKTRLATGAPLRW